MKIRKITVGRPLIDLAKLCYTANRPLLLIGYHGVGKSEILEQAAEEMGIDFVSRDLSLMEPPDLVGLPKMNEATTKYLPPDFLPTKGKGILVFEELNRCESYMRAPCLQLLTARSLNDYDLPRGWLPAAAINPPQPEYEVSDLDPALLSRFVQVTVVPSQQHWLEWARHTGVHPAVIEYAASDPSIFDKPESNPRAWKYVSDLLSAAETHRASQPTLPTAVTGVVGGTRAAAFLRFLKAGDRPLRADDILAAYSKHQKQIKDWIDDGKLDLVDSTLLSMQKYLQPQSDYESTKANRKHWHNLANFLHDLPGDLRQAARTFFSEREYTFPRRQTNREK